MIQSVSASRSAHDTPAPPNTKDDHAPNIRDALKACGGVVRSLALLVDDIEEASASIALGVEDVARELDRERRGAMSIGANVDPIAIGNTICDLLRGSLLTDEDRAMVRQRVLDVLTPPKATPAAQEPEHNGRAVLLRKSRGKPTNGKARR